LFPEDGNLQTEYWDQVADDRVFSHPLNLDVFRTLVGLKERIVDWGCGYGRTLAELHGAGYANLLGLDASARMIARASRENPHLEFRQSTGLVTREPAGSVDAIILFAVLTCIPNDDDQVRLLAECQRVLRPGGLLYVGDLYLNSDARNVARFDRASDPRGIYRSDDEQQFLASVSVLWAKDLWPVDAADGFLKNDHFDMGR